MQIVLQMTNHVERSFNSPQEGGRLKPSTYPEPHLIEHLSLCSQVPHGDPHLHSLGCPSGLVDGVARFERGLPACSNSSISLAVSSLCPPSVVRRPSSVVRHPSVSQLSLNLMHGFLSNFSCGFPWAIRSDVFSSA